MKKFFVATLSLLLAFTLAACGDDNQTSSNGDTSTSNNDSTTTSESISKEEAESIALDAVPGTIIQTELDEENDSLYYEIIIQTDTDIREVLVHTKTGEVTNVAVDYDDLTDAQKEEALQSLAEITQEEAEEIALAKVNGTVTFSQLDEDDGRPVYEIVIQTDTNMQEVHVDAITGDVLEIDVED